MKHLLTISINFFFCFTLTICTDDARDRSEREPSQSETLLHPPHIEYSSTPTSKSDQQGCRAIKEWTVMTYMAAVNDLAPYARKNLKQQADIGSNNRVNLVVQLDTLVGPHNKVTKRYYIEKDRLIIKNQSDPHSQKMDSGAPETLIEFCGWAIKNFPAQHYMLILWNHGTGIIDIGRPRSINPVQLFFFNPETQLIELDRTIPFLEWVDAFQETDPKAICFDDITGHYISNQGLEHALSQITSRFLGGKKFSIIAFDACLMAMLEIGNILKDYAHFMLSSQEVVLGPGYDYKRMLSPLVEKTLSPTLFAQSVVKTFEQTYNSITNDFTQSAINLDQLDELEKNIHTVGALLIESLSVQHQTSVRDAIKSARHKLLCTHFDEPSYLDLHHLYSNILGALGQFKYAHESRGKIINHNLRTHLQEGLNLISRVVLLHSSGKSLSQAKGISIYFPERTIHSSYHRTKFAAGNSWFSFLRAYLQA